MSEQTSPTVEASVIDIRQNRDVCTSYLVDANVLYFTRYDRYDQERYLTRSGVSDQCIDAYAAHETVARTAGSKFYVSRSVLFEFLRTVERAELHIIWASIDGAAAQGDFSGFHIKHVREKAQDRFVEAQKRIVAYLNSIAKQFLLCEVLSDLPTISQEVSRTWQGRMIDSGDAFLGAESRKSGVINILSHDADLAMLPGIRLFTANHSVIGAAKSANKLTCP